MNVKKFCAGTSREALRMVRDALGADAVILSNRSVNGGIEILALAGDDMSALAAPVAEKEVLPEPALDAPAPKRRNESEQAVSLAQAMLAARTMQTNAIPLEQPGGTAEFARVMHEIRSMRGMLETQLAEISWGGQQKREPGKAAVLRDMLGAGFSASLARYLVEKLPAGCSAEDGMKWIKAVLARNLTIVNNENEILDKGGVFALVGPTGVGKTTTTAKLAARCVMRYGAGKLALITTDGYRIGGYEQLRIYGKILGVMVHSVKDEVDLRIALDELKGKHTVLIDTVGMSQRDKLVAEQIAMLNGAGNQVKRVLCLAATSTGETLSEVVRSYQGDGLAGCVMTKLDEAATIGNALDVVIRQKLNLYYVATGQRVPEDLHVPNQQALVDQAFKMKHEFAPFQYQDSELPLVIANTARAMNESSLRGVILG